jgi:hypothetical protein
MMPFEQRIQFCRPSGPTSLLQECATNHTNFMSMSCRVIHPHACLYDSVVHHVKIERRPPQGVQHINSKRFISTALYHVTVGSSLYIEYPTLSYTLPATCQSICSINSVETSVISPVEHTSITTSSSSSTTRALSRRVTIFITQCYRSIRMYTCYDFLIRFNQQ